MNCTYVITGKKCSEIFAEECHSKTKALKTYLNAFDSDCSEVRFLRNGQDITDKVNEWLTHNRF